MTAYAFLVAITFIAHIFYRYRYLSRHHLRDINDEFNYELAHEKIERKTITFFFMLYVLLLGLRDITVGIDTRSYYTFFNKLQYMDWRSVFTSTADEFGFSIITKFIGTITNSPQVYILILAVISVLPLMYLYRNEAKDALLCCSFFLISLLFEAFFSALREGVALGLVAPAYYFARKKKIIPFILTVLVASAFHLSALILVVLYPIYHTKITFKWLWFVVPAMLVIYRYNAVIFNTLLVTMGGKYANKYLIYGYNATGQFGLLILFILISIYCFVIMDETQANEDDIGLRNIILLATALQFFAPLHVLASRVNYYFIIFIPIALTRTNAKRKNMFKQVVTLAKYIMVVYFIFYFFFMKGDSLQIMNYSFFF